MQKEEAENALRARDMILEEALDLLGPHRGNGIGDSWRARHDEHFDHQNTGAFPGQRFGPTGPSAQMPFPPVNIFKYQIDLHTNDHVAIGESSWTNPATD